MPANADLARERATSKLNVAALTDFLSGSAEETALRRSVRDLVETDPVFDLSDEIFLARPVRFKNALRRGRRIMEIQKTCGIKGLTLSKLLDAVGESSPLLLHPLMFVPNIQVLFTPEQQAKWLPKCESFEVIGCYAQTEMGHGSNIRALETTATYMPDADEFDIHTPTLTATKWWPGTLGRAGNHAMVIAQLVINGKRLGIHNFIVPLRDPKTHKHLPGVHAGDIGPKLGFHSVDNGFCQFTHVRIPRENMAMRYARVERGGKYIRRQDQGDKIAYVTMMQVRVYIVGNAGPALAKACTIAVRYSAVRRQGFDVEKGEQGGENQVLNYTIQMHRLLPMLATAYAFQLTGRVLGDKLNELEDMIRNEAQGVDVAMQEFHANSSGLKSLCTSTTADALEDIRRACGGHGYLLSSGLPELIGTYAQNCTVEGENHMLTQQTVRFLLKTTQRRPNAKGSPGGGLDCVYLLGQAAGSAAGSRDKCPAKSAEALRDPAVLEAAYTHRALRLVRVVARRLQEFEGRGMSKGQAWNYALVDIYRASRAHCFLLVLRSFRTAVEQARAGAPGQPPLDQACLGALNLLLALFGLYWIEREAGEFTQDGYLNEEQADWVSAQVVELLHEVRPEAVTLVDAWDFSDFNLQSVLGRKDGDVYTALFETTKRNPLNQSDPVDGYEEHLKPLIMGSASKQLSFASAKL